MSRWHPHRCRVCGKPSEPDDPISAQGYCGICGPARELANIEQMVTKQGPFYEHWLRRSFLAYHKKIVALNRTET